MTNIASTLARLDFTARICPLLERQISPSRGTRHARLSATFEDAHLWVYEGLTQYLGFRADCPQRSVHAGNFSRELRRHRRLGPAAARPHLASVGRHHHGGTEPLLRPFRLGQPTPRRRFLRRRCTSSGSMWIRSSARNRSGKKSLDDFCRAFFGGNDGSVEVKSYTFDELVENAE